MLETLFLPRAECRTPAHRGSVSGVHVSNLSIIKDHSKSAGKVIKSSNIYITFSQVGIFYVRNL